jgi:histidinol-phosphate aminotransferase
MPPAQAIAEVHGLDAGRIICGAGSDEIITFLCQAYAGPGMRVFTEHGFLMYRISALAVGATPVEVPSASGPRMSTRSLPPATDRTKLVFIANPNNPTGTMIGAEMARLAEGLPPQAILVLDGAYAEYVEGYDGGAALIEARDNVVMTRTFSKIYGLGGLRIGWGYGPRHVIDVLNRIRGPFNLSTTQLDAAEAAVRDQDHVPLPGRERADADLAGRGAGRDGVPSDTSMANFVLARFASQEEAEACDAFLQAQGLIVRRVAGYKLPHCLRITVGTRLLPPVAHAVAQFKRCAADLPPRRADRAGADRLVHGACDAARAGWRARSWAMRNRRDPRAWRWRSGFATGCDTAAEAVQGPTLWCWRAGGRDGRDWRPRSARIWPPGATVTDVGSVKQAVIEAVAPHMPGGRAFHSGPSLAGTEHSGPRSGFATLFQNRWWLLTPLPGTDPAAATRLRALLEAMGANVDEMDAAHHDLVLAVVSHTPHLIAYTMVGVADHLRRCRTVRGHQVFGQRLSRLHPDRRQRPDDVARRVPDQQGGDAGYPWPLHRRAVRAAARDPDGRRRCICTPISPAPARSAGGSSRPGRTRRAGFRRCLPPSHRACAAAGSIIRCGSLRSRGWR